MACASCPCPIGESKNDSSLLSSSLIPFKSIIYFKDDDEVVRGEGGVGGIGEVVLVAVGGDINDDESCAAVPVPEIVALAVGVADSVIVAVVESVPLLLLLVDGNAPIVTEEVGD